MPSVSGKDLNVTAYSWPPSHMRARPGSVAGRLPGDRQRGVGGVVVRRVLIQGCGLQRGQALGPHALRVFSVSVKAWP